MASLTGKTPDELADELRGVVFRLPEPVGADGNPRYVTSDEYLSGNVREKLRDAERALAVSDVFLPNVEALKAAQPKDLDASEIEVRLGATWIGKEYIQEFMKYYEKMLDMGCFTKDDVVMLAGSEGAAHSLLYDYTRNRLIERVRRNLYAAVSLETKQPVANRYVIASHLAPDACVSHHSAFEVYGYANQVYYEVYVQTELRFTDFEYNGATYRRVSPRISDGVTKWNGNVRVTTPERTVIDSINDFEKIGGLEELLRCIELIPSLDPMR